MIRTALVTGASSGIGEAISAGLLAQGWEVFGIGRGFSDSPLTGNPDFHALCIDVTCEKELDDTFRALPVASISLLVNCAGAAWYGMHETISADSIRAMTRTNLEAPMILSAKLLRPLRENRGMIINIASVTALAPSPHGAAYGALKAGLLHFSRTLFEENRKFGVRVTTVMPDMTDTNLYRNADFEADPSEGASLTAKQVADAVLQVISQPEGSVISELVLKPQYHRIRRRH